MSGVNRFKKKNKIVERLESNRERIYELLENKAVMEYIDLMLDQEKLDYETKKVLFREKRKVLMNCKHILVRYDNPDMNRYSYLYCCLKCGLDTYFKSDLLFKPASSDEYQMYQVLKEKELEGIYIDEYTNRELANSIYNGIIKKYPNISDANLSKYFRVARHGIMQKGKDN